MTDIELLQQKLELKEAELRLKKGLPFLHGYKHFPWSLEFLTTRNHLALLCAANQIGKDLSDFTEIPTTKGFKLMRDLVVGDHVFAQDGSPTEILEIPYVGKGPGYKVIFSDGSSVIAGPNHEWVCKTSRERFRKVYTPSARSLKGEFENKSYGEWITLTTKEIVEAGGYAPDARSAWRKVSIPVCAPAQMPSGDLFDPYLLGLMVGDGCFRSAVYTVTSMDKEIVDHLLLHGAKRTGATITYRMPLAVRNEIDRLGLGNHLSNAKFIPEEYFLASAEDRLALLQGLMDTDGTVTLKNSNTSFTTVSPRLAADVRTLVCSLGGTVKTKKRKSGYRNKEGEYVPCQDSYTLFIKIKQCPFRLPRKAAKHRGEIRYKHERVIDRIEPIAEINSRCITVAHTSGTFLATRDYIVTHNSTAQIRRALHWATEPDLWGELWPRAVQENNIDPAATPPKGPTIFYFYPTATQATIEFQEKWLPQYLPRGEFKDDPKYGWKEEYKNKEIFAIYFNSGAAIYFKSYKQGPTALQTATVHYLCLDEECPVELWSELSLRVAATDGYISMAFTATLGQEMWRQAMEPGAGEEEKFATAWKKQISMYDCQYFTDGTPSRWTDERVNQVISLCKNTSEVQRRVFGKFIKDSGLIYPTFDPKRHVKPWHPIPKSWAWYQAVDIGSGQDGDEGAGHPSGIVLMAVRPDYQAGRVVDVIRTDGERTTAGDVMLKADAQVKEFGVQPTARIYDWGSAEFQIMASRAGGGWIPAEKDHEKGEKTLNTLFKNDMVAIYERGQNGKLVGELCSLGHSTPKRHRKDDVIDPTRYLCFHIPWDWTVLQTYVTPEQAEKAAVPLTPEEESLRRRREFFDDSENQRLELEAEFAEANALCEH